MKTKIWAVCYYHNSKKVSDWTDTETIYTHNEQEAGDLANLFGNSESFTLVVFGLADDVDLAVREHFDALVS
jgi:hypothetical protein